MAVPLNRKRDDSSGEVHLQHFQIRADQDQSVHIEQHPFSRNHLQKPSLSQLFSQQFRAIHLQFLLHQPRHQCRLEELPPILPGG